MSPPVILASMGAVVAATFSATYLLTRCECQEPAPCLQAWKAPPGSKFTASFDPTLDPKRGARGSRIYWYTVPPMSEQEKRRKLRPRSFRYVGSVEETPYKPTVIPLPNAKVVWVAGWNRNDVEEWEAGIIFRVDAANPPPPAPAPNPAAPPVE